MYDFTLFGNLLSFKTNLVKHITLSNEYRVKDYLIVGLEDFPTSKYKLSLHPAEDIIKTGIDFLRSKGWMVAPETLDGVKTGEIGFKSPTGEYYHTHKS